MKISRKCLTLLRKKGLSSNLEKEEFDFVILEDLNLDDEILESCILKAPDDMDPLKFFNSDDLEIFLNKIKDKFDHILIDTPPMGTFIDAKLLCGKSDTIIIILSSHLSTFGEITSMKKEKRIIEMLGEILDALEASFTILILLRLDAAERFRFNFCCSLWIFFS